MSKCALVKIVTAVAFLWPALSQARPKSHPLNEDEALDVLVHTLQRDHVYDKRISLDCVTFDTEDTTRIYFQVALREKHNKKCGGDPDTSPVIDRYKINRASGKIEWYNPPKDVWDPYNPALINTK
jgi:hypothetical protein